MGKIVLIYALLVYALMSSCPRQNGLLKQTNPYFGQKPPGTQPELFAPGLISTTACELHGSFSPDGKEFFYTRRDSVDGYNNRIMYLYEKEGKWTKPLIAPFAEDCIELFAQISQDGNKAFFLSERAHPITGKLMKNDEKIWYSEKTESGWGKAHFLDSPVNEGWLLSVDIVQDDILYISGEYGNQGGIFRSIPINGHYQSAEFLFDGAHPYVSPNESYIIFDRFDNYGNSALYVSFMDKTGQWKEPIILSSEINSTKSEAFAEVSPDGRFLFFHRQGDIYWVDIKTIEDLNLQK